MNRAGMREILRRRLNESSADFWSDSALNTLLETAAYDVQCQLLVFNPLCLLNWMTTPITHDVQFYAKPVGFWWEYEFGVKLTAAATAYSYYDSPLPYKRLRDTQEAGYAHVGRHFYLSPKPAEDVAAGIQLLYTPLLSMSDDTSVPDISPAYHMAILVKAHLLTFPETAESPLQAAVMDEWKKETEKFPLVAQQSYNGPMRLWLPPESIGRQ